MTNPVAGTKRYSTSRILAITAGGSVLEYYDYALYGIAAAVIFNTQFFPSLSSGLGTVVSLGTFASGVLMKPVGALVFSHFGDRLGRARVLFMTMIVLGLSTTLIGVLPNYHTIGIWAPLVLVLFRLIQGFAAGAEMPGSGIFGMEASPPGQRGLYASFTSMGSGIGATLALLGFLVLRSVVPAQAFYDWVWRIPFLSASTILVFVYFARRGIVATERYDFERRDDVVRVPIREVFARFKRPFAATTVVVTGYLACSALAAVYSLSYLKTVGFSDNETFIAQLIFQIPIIALVPVVGVISDRTNRKAVVSFGAIATGLLFSLFFTLSPHAPVVVIYLLNGLLAVSVSTMYGGLLAFTAEQFPVRVRYSGMGVAFSLGGALGGGFSPIVAASVFEYSPNGTVGLAILSLVVCGLVLGGSAVMKNYANVEDDQLEDTDRRLPPSPQAEPSS